jgi:tape measure domain-containing protein
VAEKELKFRLTADDQASSKISGVGMSMGKMTGAVAMGTAAYHLLAGAATAAFDVLKRGAKYAFDQASAMQKTSIQMQALADTTQSGNKAFAELYKYALTAPFAFPQIAVAGKTLMAFGISAQDVTNHVKDLGNIALVTGSEIDHLAEVYGKVAAKGKLMGREILQLVENGVAIVPALQETLGVTADEVYDMASRGEIDFETFRTAMNTIADPTIIEKFENTLPRQMDKLQGSFRTLALEFLGIEISAEEGKEGFIIAADGLYQTAINLMSRLVEVLRSPEFKEAAREIGEKMKEVITSLAEKIEQIDWAKVSETFISIVDGIGWVIEKLIALSPYFDELLIAIFAIKATQFGVAIATWASGLTTAATQAGVAATGITAMGVNASVAAPIIGTVLALAINAVWTEWNKTKKEVDAIRAESMPALSQSIEYWDKKMQQATGATQKKRFREMKESAQSIKNEVDATTNATNIWAETVKNVCTTIMLLLGPVGWAIKAIIDKLTTANYKASTLPNLGIIGKGSPFEPKLKQLGGPVGSGNPYLVGEQGPEIFVPSQSGKIIPNHHIYEGDSTSNNIHMNVNVGMYAGTPIEQRNIAEKLYQSLIDIANQQNKTVSEYFEGA